MEGLQSALADHGILILFLLALIEGPLVVLAATALAQMGAADIRIVWAVAVLADLAGDMLLYAFGRCAPGLLPPRLRPQLVRQKAVALFRQRGPQLLLAAKLTHFAGLPTLISAGFGSMSLLPFLVWTLIGTVLKVSIIILIGWHFWRAIGAGDMTEAVTVLIVLCGCCALVFAVMQVRRWI